MTGAGPQTDSLRILARTIISCFQGIYEPGGRVLGLAVGGCCQKVMPEVYFKCESRVTGRGRRVAWSLNEIVY